MNRAQRRAYEAGPVQMVIFHRADGWYPLELPRTDDIAEHAASNPGTLKVTDAVTEEILWVLH